MLLLFLVTLIGLTLAVPTSNTLSPVNTSNTAQTTAGKDTVELFHRGQFYSRIGYARDFVGCYGLNFGQTADYAILSLIQGPWTACDYFQRPNCERSDDLILRIDARGSPTETRIGDLKEFAAKIKSLSCGDLPDRNIPGVRIVELPTSDTSSPVHTFDVSNISNTGNTGNTTNTMVKKWDIELFRSGQFWDRIGLCEFASNSACCSLRDRLGSLIQGSHMICQYFKEPNCKRSGFDPVLRIETGDTEDQHGDLKEWAFRIQSVSCILLKGKKRDIGVQAPELQARHGFLDKQAPEVQARTVTSYTIPPVDTANTAATTSDIGEVWLFHRAKFGEPIFQYTGDICSKINFKQADVWTLIQKAGAVCEYYKRDNCEKAQGDEILVISSRSNEQRVDDLQERGWGGKIQSFKCGIDPMVRKPVNTGTGKVTVFHSSDFEDFLYKYEGGDCSKDFGSKDIFSIIQGKDTVCEYYQQTGCEQEPDRHYITIDTRPNHIDYWGELGDWGGVIRSFRCSIQIPGEEIVEGVSTRKVPDLLPPNPSDDGKVKIYHGPNYEGFLYEYNGRQCSKDFDRFEINSIRQDGKTVCRYYTRVGCRRDPGDKWVTVDTRSSGKDEWAQMNEWSGILRSFKCGFDNSDGVAQASVQGRTVQVETGATPPGTIRAYSEPNFGGNLLIAYEGDECSKLSFKPGAIKSIIQGPGTVCNYYIEVSCKTDNANHAFYQYDTRPNVEYRWYDMTNLSGKIFSFKCGVEPGPHPKMQTLDAHAGAVAIPITPGSVKVFQEPNFCGSSQEVTAWKQCSQTFKSGTIKSLKQQQGAVCHYYQNTGCEVSNHVPIRREDSRTAAVELASLGEWEGEILSFQCDAE